MWQRGLVLLRVVYGRNRDKAHTIFHGLSQREWILWEGCCGGRGWCRVVSRQPRELFVDTSRRLGIKAPRETIFDFAVSPIRTVFERSFLTYARKRTLICVALLFFFLLFCPFKIPLNFANAYQ